MNNQQKGFVTPPVVIGVVLLVLVSGVVYFYSGSDSKETEVKTKLANVQSQLKLETAKLNNMEETFSESYSIYSILRAQYTNAQTVVDTTSAFFTSAGVLDLDIKTKDPQTKKDIDAKYTKVKALLEAWKDKTERSYAKNVTISTLSAIKKDATVIQSFVKELTLIISSLSPENSLFSEFQIEQYEDMLAEVLIEIETSIEVLEETIQSQPTAPTINTAPTPVQVTAEQIQIQQNVVAELQAEVLALQEALEQIQAEEATPDDIPESTPPPQPPPPPPLQSKYIPQIDTVNSKEEERYLFESETIIISPATPSFIQGSNNN